MFINSASSRNINWMTKVY